MAAPTYSPPPHLHEWLPAPPTTAPPPPPTTAAPQRASRARLVSQARPRPAAAPQAPAPSSGGLLARIRWCESRDNYQAQNRHSTASGAYQELDSTWRSWQASYGDGRSFARAMYAPADLQDLVASRALAAQGTRPWAASRSCWSS